jgi:hypothetical protein
MSSLHRLIVSTPSRCAPAGLAHASRCVRRIVIGRNGPALFLVGRLARASQATVVLEFLEGHSATHANPPNEIEVVAARIGGHCIFLCRLPPAGLANTLWLPQQLRQLPR